MLERFELRWTGLKHKKINKKYFYSDFIFCEKACYACYRGGDLSKKGPLRFELVLRGKRINRKKLNVKTLSRPRTIKRTYTKVQTPTFVIWTWRPDKDTVSSSVIQRSPIIIVVGSFRFLSCDATFHFTRKTGDADGTCHQVY